LKRWLWIAGLAALLVGAIVYGLRPQPAPVEVAAVKQAPLRVTVEEEGKTRLRSRYVVSAPVAGYLRRLPWKEGDHIQAGQVVAVIEPPPPAVLDARTREQAAARLQAAEAALNVAQARVLAQQEQLRVARAEQHYWRRQQERDEALHQSGDVPLSRVERTETERQRADGVAAAAERSLAAAQAEVATAAAEVAAARAALRESAAGAGGEQLAVRAPSGGRVIKVMRESEGTVLSGEGLIELGDARAIEVVVEVLSADAVKMLPGARVVLERWGGDTPLEARVRVVEPGGFTKISALGVEEQRVRVVADIVSPEPLWQRLGDGYRVEAVFVLWEGERVLQAPASALFRSNGGWAVFVVDGGLARRRTVEVGRRSATAAEIVAGLAAGELVVAHPDDTVSDGKAVTYTRP
jgi:HlyD family secretion protein